MSSTVLSAIDKGSGPAIVWIHGFPLSSAIFEPQLSIPGVRHVIPDLPGFGASPPPNDSLAMDDYADAVAGVLQGLGVPVAVVAGVSMGGYVVFAMLRRHAALASAAILIDTRETADSPEALEGRSVMAETARREGAPPIATQMFPKMLTAETVAMADWRTDVVRRAMATATVPGVVSALSAMASRPDSSATIRAAAIPLLAVAGDRDTITPSSDAERMASLAADGAAAIIADAAHLSNVERPAEFNRIVQAFLARIR